MTWVGFDRDDEPRDTGSSWVGFNPSRTPNRSFTQNLKEIGTGLLGKLLSPLVSDAGQYMAGAQVGRAASGPVFTGDDIRAAFAARGREAAGGVGAGPSGYGAGSVFGSMFADPAVDTPFTPDSTAAFGQRLANKPWQPDLQQGIAAQGLQDLRQQWFQEREQTIKDAVAAVNAQYAGPLDELRQRLSDFQVGDREIQAAYADFQADIDTIGVGVAPAEGLDETRVVDTVQENYHGYEGALGEAFAKIDSDGNPGMSEALAEELRTFETVIEDSLRTDLGSMEDLHNLSSQYAEALAGFAYSDDKYRADQERTLAKAQMDKAIKDQKDAIARTEKEMREAAARAKQNVIDNFGEFNVDMATMQEEAFRQFASQQGLTPDQISANWQVIQGIMEQYGTSIVTSGDFRGYANQYVNQNNFDKMGLTAQLQRYIQEASALVPPEGIEDEKAWVDQQIARRTKDVTRLLNANWDNAVREKGVTSDVFATQLASMGINADPYFRRMWENPSEFDTMAENTLLLDGWKIMKETEDNWQEISSTGARYFTQDQLSVAPSGYTFPVVGTNWGSGGGYGYVKPSGRTHQGVDIGAYRGSPIVAPADGTIESKGWSDMSGWYVRLRDKNGNLHKFMHLDKEPTIGGQVRAGTQIGAVGRTGNASGGGPHLHYEIWNRGGSSMDPASWLKQTGGWQIGDPPGNYMQGYI